MSGVQAIFLMSSNCHEIYIIRMSIKFSFQKGFNQLLELIFRGVMVINMQQNKVYFVPNFPSNSMKK